MTQVAPERASYSLTCGCVKLVEGNEKGRMEDGKGKMKAKATQNSCQEDPPIGMSWVTNLGIFSSALSKTTECNGHTHIRNIYVIPKRNKISLKTEIKE